MARWMVFAQDLMGRMRQIMVQDNPRTFLGRIQLACEIENREQVVKLLWLQH